jgi:hypothetical protein
VKTSSKTISLRELVQSPQIRVDREGGAIRGVKILGSASLNKREYLPEAITAAKGRYEGVVVNFDHPPKHNPGRETPIADRAGWLENVEVAPDGLKGDLFLLKADPRTEKVMEAAERRPELFGLSHNVDGKVRRQNGKTLVEEITRVRSVDLVSDPATTRSLFESLEKEECEMAVTLKEHLDTLNVNHPKVQSLHEFIELGLVAGDTEIEDEMIGKLAKLTEGTVLANVPLHTWTLGKPEAVSPKEAPPDETPKMLETILENQESLQKQLTEMKGQMNVTKPASGQQASGNGITGKKSDDAKQFMEAITGR